MLIPKMATTPKIIRNAQFSMSVLGVCWAYFLSGWGKASCSGLASSPNLRRPPAKRHRQAGAAVCGMTMGRLISLKSALPTLRPSIAYLPQGERERDRARAALPWRQWYNTTRWRKLRLQVFLRDNYTCQATGQVLAGKAPAPDSPVADHRKAHHGDPVLFWDDANIWTVSKAYHDSVKQKAEAAERLRPRGG